MLRISPVESSGRRSFALTERIADAAARAWRAYGDWRLRRDTLLLLRALDTRTLRDIGVDPANLEDAVKALSIPPAPEPHTRVGLAPP